MILPSQSITERLNRAKRYPFRIPQQSYIFYDGADYPLQLSQQLCLHSSNIYWQEQWISMQQFYATHQLDAVEELGDRIPVLAAGSNASPEQLARKFARLKKAIVPVLKAQMLNFDVVYSAHFSSYGSIPATVYYSPGTTLNIFITYLTPLQLEQMHQTEGLGYNYSFARLDRVELILENQAILNQVQCYLSLHGCLCRDRSPIGLEMISAQTRQVPQMNQVEVLNYAMEQLDPNKTLDDFILETICHRTIRQHRIEGLKKISKPFNYHHL